MTQLESMKMALQLNNEEIFRRIPKQNPDSSVSISHFDEVVEDLISTPVEFEFITNGITNIGKSVSLLHDIRDYKKIALTFNTFSASNNPSSFVTNEFYVSDLINDNGVFIANYFGISAPWGSESDVNVCSVYLLGEACTPTSLYINNVYNHNAISTKGKLYIKGIKTCVKEEAGTLDDIAPTIGENGNWYVMGKDTGVKAQGQDGIIGSDGKSAYELAVKNGYTGTETEWLTSLQGNPGQDGKDGINGINGIDGTNGVDGKSAYQLWLDQGNTGNETDFLESLKGKNGEPGQNGAPGENGLPGIDGKSAYQSALDNGFTGTELEWLESLKGEDGTGVSVSYFDETIENLISVPFEFTMSGNNGGTTIDKSIPLLNDIRKYKKIAFTAIMWSGSDPATNSSAILTNEFYVSDLVDNNGNFLLNAFSVNISSGGSSASKAASVIFLGKGKSTVMSLWFNSTWNYALTYNKGKIYIKGIKECVKEVKGTLDDITPKIGESGNWVVLNKDTGVKAQGNDGQPGVPGQDGQQGPAGENGTDGKSAYQIWLDEGNTGTKADFLASLKGENGTGLQVTYFDEAIENIITTPIEFNITAQNGTTVINRVIPLPRDIREYTKIVLTANMFWGNSVNDAFSNEYYISDIINNNGNFIVGFITLHTGFGATDGTTKSVILWFDLSKSTTMSLNFYSVVDAGSGYTNGKLYIKGIKKSVKETRGTLDDIAPKIGKNGNWVVLDKDTGVKAKGEDGQPGAKGEPGQNGEPGVKGEDGQTPYIGENGNWWYGDTDSGIPGPKIEDCIKVADNTNGIQDTPIGHIIAHMGTVAPKHYLICDGTIYNIADYPHLTKHIKDNFGNVNYFGGNGTTTFAVPDLRGEFLRGTGKEGGDVGGHQAGTDIIGGYFGNSIGAIYNGKDLSYTDMPNKADSWQAATGDTYMHTTTRSESRQYPNTIGKGTSRPTNTSVLYCIKYEPTYFIQIVKPEVEYSLEEQRIGTWIDGKPIYRKIIETQLPSESLNTWYDITSLDIKNLINIKTISVNDSLSETGWMTAPLEGLNFFYLYKKSEKVYIAVMDLQNATSDGWNKPVTIFLEYTKKS